MVICANIYTMSITQTPNPNLLPHMVTDAEMPYLANRDANADLADRMVALDDRRDAKKGQERRKNRALTAGAIVASVGALAAGRAAAGPESGVAWVTNAPIAAAQALKNRVSEVYHGPQTSPQDGQGPELGQPGSSDR